jgi:hypothetical protein
VFLLTSELVRGPPNCKISFVEALSGSPSAGPAGDGEAFGVVHGHRGPQLRAFGRDVSGVVGRRGRSAARSGRRHALSPHPSSGAVSTRPR